jgi:hypothetical protein
MAKLQDFLLNGQIGDIRVGMLPGDVERRWGPAQDRTVQRRPIEILKYGSIELAFGKVPGTADSRLVSAAIYFFNPQRTLPPNVIFEDWSPSGETFEREFREYLASIKVDVHSKGDDENTYLELESGASVVFVEGRLHSIHYHRRDRREVRRQVSVSMPEVTLNQLRDRARRENVPLNELIERVLSKNI